MAWLKLRQYAELTGYSYNTIYAKVMEGVLPAYRLGRQWRIDPEEANAVLRQSWEGEKAKAEKRKARKENVKHFADDAAYLAAIKAVKSKWKPKEVAQ